jgi:hypothetical protein
MQLLKIYWITCQKIRCQFKVYLMKSKTFNRRDFISKSSLGLMGASAGVISYDGSTDNREFRSDQDRVRIRDYRILGRTGFKVSDIGCGPGMMTNENLLKAVIDTGVFLIQLNFTGTAIMNFLSEEQ